MKYILFLLHYFFITQLFSQTPTQQWLNRYNGDGDFSDKYNCVLTDNNGNVYIGGYTVNANQRKDYLLVKYTSSGTLSWSVTYNGSDNNDDEILAMAFGLNNQIIVTGYAKGNTTDDDIVTISYDQNGQVIWTAIYDNLLYSQDDQGNDISVDVNGNVIVVGQTETSTDDYIILSYSSTGSLNWSAFYDGTAMSKDRALKVKIGSGNSVYVTGRSANLQDDDIVTRKYSSSGNLLWTQTFNNGWNDRPTDLKLDALENVYVCGYSNNGTNDDILILKYSSLGIDQWIGGYIYNGPNSQDERASSMVLDPNGNIFITGYCDNDPGVTENFDYQTLKISSSKNLLWQVVYNGIGNGEDKASSIGILASGDVVVTGKSDADINNLISNFDVNTICYSSLTGSQTWIKSHSGAANKDDIGNELAIDNSGNIFVVGGSQDNISESDGLAIKYSSSGVENWFKLFAGNGDNTENVNCMTLDATGNTYLAGYTYSRSNLKDLCVIKLNPFGDTLWVKKYNGSDNKNDEATDIKVDASGNVYVTGFIKDSITDFDIITLKMNSNGDFIWISQFNNNTVNGEDKGNKLEIDASGNVYVLGYTDRNPLFIMNEDIVLLKYSSVGAQQWVKQYNGTSNLADIPFDLCYLPSGKIVLTGSTDNSSDDDIISIAYNTSGTQLWSKIFAGAGGGKDEPVEMDFDNAENIYIAGRSSNGNDNDALVIKYSSTGTQVWTNIFDNNTNDDRSTCLDVNSSGSVFVSGTTDDGNQSNIFVRSISSAGVVNWTKNYDNGSLLNDEPFDIKIDNNGDILIAGSAEANGTSGPHRNYLLLKYSSAGNLWWNKIYDNGINGNDEINVCEIDASNNIYVSGQSISLTGQRDIVTIKYDSPLKIKDQSEIAVNLYPNPFTEFTEMKLDYDNFSDISIRIIDMFGREIRSEKIVDGKIERGNLKSGMYILQVFNINSILGISTIIIQDKD